MRVDGFTNAAATALEAVKDGGAWFVGKVEWLGSASVEHLSGFATTLKATALKVWAYVQPYFGKAAAALASPLGLAAGLTGASAWLVLASSEQQDELAQTGLQVGGIAAAVLAGFFLKTGLA